MSSQPSRPAARTLTPFPLDKYDHERRLRKLEEPNHLLDQWLMDIGSELQTVESFLKRLLRSNNRYFVTDMVFKAIQTVVLVVVLVVSLMVLGHLNQGDLEYQDRYNEVTYTGNSERMMAVDSAKFYGN